MQHCSTAALQHAADCLQSNGQARPCQLQLDQSVQRGHAGILSGIQDTAAAVCLCARLYNRMGLVDVFDISEQEHLQSIRNST